MRGVRGQLAVRPVVDLHRDVVDQRGCQRPQADLAGPLHDVLEDRILYSRCQRPDGVTTGVLAKTTQRTPGSLAYPPVHVTRKLIEDVVNAFFRPLILGQRHRHCLSNLPFGILRELAQYGNKFGLVILTELTTRESSGYSLQTFNPPCPRGIPQLIED